MINIVMTNDGTFQHYFIPKDCEISHYYLILIDIIFLLKTYDIVCMI